MTETSSDNEHDKDVMVLLMFETICLPEDEAARGVVVDVIFRWLARRADCRRQLRKGQAGKIRCGGNNHGQGEDYGDVGIGDT